MSDIEWFDSHCHLDMVNSDTNEVVRRANAAGVKRMVCVATDVATSRECVAIAREHKGVYASIGLHPHDAKHGTDELGKVADELIPTNRDVIVGIGEAGLDYFYEHSPKNLQRSVFEFQIDSANRFDLSLIIHTRDAWLETFEILQKVGVPSRAVLHCFTGGVEEARRCLDLGLFISFSGICTFKNSKEVQAAAAFCPLDRIVVETDSPFLTPVPHRGRPNEPSNVGVVGSFISELKKLRVEEFAQATKVNTEQLFNLQSP